jgi:hypothetical protein
MDQETYKTVDLCCPTKEAEDFLSTTITLNEGLGYQLVSYSNINTVTVSDSGEEPGYEYSTYHMVFAPICKN